MYDQNTYIMLIRLGNYLEGKMPGRGLQLLFSLFFEQVEIQLTE
jgi:hypothetical protein